MSQEDIDATKAPLMDHLIELRARLIRSLYAFFAAFLVCFYFSRTIYNILTEPYVRGVGMAQRVVTRWAIDLNVTTHPLYKKDNLTSRMLLIHTDPELQEAFRAWYAGTETVDALLLSLTP